MNNGIIYGLFDPTTKEIRYVGQTTQNNIKKRFNRHLYDARHSSIDHKSNWIREILKENLKPEINILEDGISLENLTEKEQHWFNYYIDLGKDLVNTGACVDSPLRGTVFSLESKEKLSKSHLGQISPMKGKHHSEESKLKMSLARKGRFSGVNSPRFGSTLSNESKLKMTNSLKGRVHSKETKEKMSKSQKLRWERFKKESSNESSNK